MQFKNATDFAYVSAATPLPVSLSGTIPATIADDTTTNATMYPTWVTAATGNLPIKVSSTKLSFNPSTGALTVGGAISGTTGTFSGLVTAKTSTTAGVAFYAPMSVAASQYQDLRLATASSGSSYGAAVRGGLNGSGAPYGALMHYTDVTETQVITWNEAVVQISVPLDIAGAAASATASHLQIGSTTQTTIGANGGASALTANPLGYIKAFIGSTAIIIPYYNA